MLILGIDQPYLSKIPRSTRGGYKNALALSETIYRLSAVDYDFRRAATLCMAKIKWIVNLTTALTNPPLCMVTQTALAGMVGGCHSLGVLCLLDERPFVNSPNDSIGIAFFKTQIVLTDEAMLVHYTL